jgi:hypothetical protein
MTTLSAVNRSSPIQETPDVAGTPPVAASAASLLPEPSVAGFGGDSVAALAALLTRADEQDRAHGRALEHTEDAAAMKDADQEVEAMRERADDDEKAAVTNGVAEAAGGALTIGSAFVASPADPKKDINWNTALQGGAKLSEGVGKILAAGYTASAEQDGATAAKFGAASEADVRAYNEAHDEAQAASDAMQKVEQFLDQFQQTNNATRLLAANFRA